MRLWILLGCLLGAVDARAEEAEPSRVDPNLPAGAVLGVLGGASMVAGAGWLGDHQRTACPELERCSEHGVEGASLGLLTGGFVAAAMGIGVAYGASLERQSVPQRDALVGTGVVFTGLCAAGVVGSSTSLAFLFRHGDPALLGIAPTLIASAALCGLGVPLWIVGTRPPRARVAARRERASAAELDGWPVRSPTMTAVGIGMTSLGVLMVPAGFSYGYLEGRRGPGAQGQGGILGGLVSGVFFVFPAAPLLVGGSLLLRSGAERVPPGWEVSFAPTSDGLALTVTSP